MGHERIRLTDNPMNMLIKLAEGNPGGLNVIMQIIEKGSIIDPDAAFGPLAHIFGLDTFGIYGSRIWMFYKDACGEDLQNMIAVMRAVQLGKLSEQTMHHAIDNYGEGLDIKAIIEIVQTELPNFGQKIAPQDNAESAGTDTQQTNCPSCKGTGGYAPEQDTSKEIVCGHCKGTGKLSPIA